MVLTEGENILAVEKGNVKKQFSFSHALAIIIKAARGNVKAIGLSPQYYIAFAFSSDFSLFFSDELWGYIVHTSHPKLPSPSNAVFILFFPLFTI